MTLESPQRQEVDHGKNRAEIFAALAQGLDLAQILERFRLSAAELRKLFKEAADYYRDQDQGFWRLYCDGASRGNPVPAEPGPPCTTPRGKSRPSVAGTWGKPPTMWRNTRPCSWALNWPRNLGPPESRSLPIPNCWCTNSTVYTGLRLPISSLYGARPSRGCKTLRPGLSPMCLGNKIYRPTPWPIRPLTKSPQRGKI